MKAIKTILGALAVASLLGFSFNASAQENNNRDENGKIVRGPYETNKFWDNWFIGVGAGVNASIDFNSDFSFGGLALDVNAGKWFTPTVGARVGYKGIKNDLKLQNGVNSAYGNGFDQHYVHADFLWNLSNSFSGYKETRFWDVIPYVSAGVIDFKNDGRRDLEYGLGAGLLNDLRLGKHVDLFIDLSGIVAPARVFGYNGAGVSTNKLRRISVLPSLTAGLIFNLGRTNFDRHSTITPVVVPVPFTTEQYNALKDRVAALEKENAALKNEIEALKNQAPDTVYVGETGSFAKEAYAYFDMGGAVLSDREKMHLDYFIDNVASKLEDGKTLVVSGSADKATGSVKRNQQLAEQRANAVKKYLVKKGVAESKIQVEVLGGIAGAADARRSVITVK